MRVKIYVEGGGDHNKELQTKCRRGFAEFFRKSGLEGRLPRVVACGGRRRAFESFRASYESHQEDELPILLVDSEDPVVVEPWDHVRLRPGDGWQRPHGASPDQIHLMVQAMEAWFHADKDKLAEYYGRDFRVTALSQGVDIENIPKPRLFAGLQNATRDCQKGEYSKGEHSFELLAQIDPVRVRASSPVHAERLLVVLDRICVR